MVNPLLNLSEAVLRLNKDITRHNSMGGSTSQKEFGFDNVVFG
jgi:hypothetical protein